MSVNLLKTNQLNVLIRTEIYNYVMHSAQSMLMKQSLPSSIRHFKTKPEQEWKNAFLYLQMRHSIHSSLACELLLEENRQKNIKDHCMSFLLVKTQEKLSCRKVDQLAYKLETVHNMHFNILPEAFCKISIKLQRQCTALLKSIFHNV